MKQSSYSIGCAQGRLRAIAGDHFISLPIKVKKSDVSTVLDADEVLRAGTLLTVDGKAITTTTGTPATTNAYGVVYEDVSFKGSMSSDTVAGNATEVVALFVHGALYESEVKFSADTVVGGKDAEKAALKQIIFI